MDDPLCILMGIMDIVAGVLIIFSFMNLFAGIFGAMMILKGGMSLIQ